MTALSMTKAGWAAEGDMCKDSLAVAYNETVTQAGSSDNEYFRKWQCSTDFGTHNDAISAGVGIGVPIYGVPVKFDGSWNQSAKDDWKKANCSENEKNTSQQSATYQFIKSVSPEVVAAWSKCMDGSAIRTSLSCSMTRTGNRGTFTANWLRHTGDTEVNTPKVSYFSVAGGTCDRQLPRDSTVPEAAVQMSCTPATESTLTVMLETQGGSCWKTLDQERTTYTIGNVSMDGDLFVKADVVQFPLGSKITTNGHRLTIEAKSIQLSGTPQIISFPSTAAPGRSSMNAGQILITARKVEGTSLSIDNHGQDGSDGNVGDTGPIGPSGQQGQQASWDPIKFCHGRTSSTDGGKGGPGGPGYPGKPGGSAGLVSISVNEGVAEGIIRRIFEVSQRTDPRSGAIKTCSGSCGGFGGAGGGRGPGGMGGPGGLSVPGTFHCGGGSAGHQGPFGDSGPLGAMGPDGPDAPVMIAPGAASASQ